MRMSDNCTPEALNPHDALSDTFKMFPNKKLLLRYYSEQQDDEQRMYNADPLRSHGHACRLRRIAHMADCLLPFSDGARILDIGCGDGYAAASVLQHRPYSICLGLDLSVPKLRSMRARLTRCFPLAGDSESVPLKSSHFDIVFCFELLEHVPEPVCVLREIKRLLRPRGRCLISTPAASFIQPLLVRAVTGLRTLNGGREKFHEHLHFMSLTRLRPVFEKTGLKIVAHELAGFRYPLKSLIVRRASGERLIALDQWLAGKLRFGLFEMGRFAIGNEYLIICAEPV